MGFGVRAAAIAAMMSSLAVACHAALLLNQPDFGDSGFFADGVAGQYWDSRQAEDFSIVNPAFLTSVTFWGCSEYFTSPDLANMDSWVIRIFHGTAGSVGSEVWNGTFSKAATNPVYTGMDSTLGAYIYRQTVALPNVAIGSGFYWISIGSDNADPGGDGWLWMQTLSAHTNREAQESPFGSSGWTVYSDDVAIVLEGTVVPEPATVLVLGGLSAAALMRRKR